MQRNFFKIFVFIVLIAVLLFLYTMNKDMAIVITREDKIISSEKIDIKIINQSNMETNVTDKVKVNLRQPNIKYILQWTSPKTEPFKFMGVGRSGFTDRNCSYTNCFVTSNRGLLGDYTKFDVIAFFGPKVIRYRPNMLPVKRSPHQKFVFATVESSGYYPICSNRFDGYFNWTWTFRLDSDSNWGYIVVRDFNNKVIGPNKIMHWMKVEDMDPVTTEFKEQLKSKTKAAAWFVSNCHSRSGRGKFIKKLRIEMKKYNLTIDVYGRCGSLSCSKNMQDTCAKLIKDKYYFYLSFENSFSEDYVTEKLLLGLKNNAVPIVYGAANYTRFMPHGIYLNARELGVKKLARKLYELINDPEQYADYFRWKNHYSYYAPEDSEETDDFCGFCKLLNDEKRLKETSVIQNFRKWWDSPDLC